MDHIVRDELIVPANYPDDPSRKIKLRLFVEGARLLGYRVGIVPRGCEGRQVDCGPLVPGPWAFSFGCMGIIDMHGGSRAEIDQERAEGRIIEAKVGDRLIISGDAYRIDYHPNGREWITLTLEA